MTHVLYLDRYHLGDPLFLNGFARDVLAFDGPLVLVHGAGEAAERALEAQGRFPASEGGVLAVETEGDRALVARAARDLGRQIAHTLNDAGVAAVRLEASGRGLIRATDDGIETGNTKWLRGIVGEGAVPVIAALVGEVGGAVREIGGGALAGALARSFAESGAEAQAVFLTKNGQNGLIEGDSTRESAGVEALPAGVVAEPSAVRAALATGAEVVVTGRSGLRQTPLVGTRIREGLPK
jgi:acetylglutamate kinase